MASRSQDKTILSLYRYQIKTLIYRASDCITDHWLWKASQILKNFAPITKQMENGSARMSKMLKNLLNIYKIYFSHEKVKAEIITERSSKKAEK